jgi:hypothetical protein
MGKKFLLNTLHILLKGGGNKEFKLIKKTGIDVHIEYEFEDTVNEKKYTLKHEPGNNQLLSHFSGKLMDSFAVARVIDEKRLKSISE